MPKLINALRSWSSDDFEEILTKEIEDLGTSGLPLEGYVDDSELKVIILGISDNETEIQANVGIFYHEIIAGCSCGDDPTRENAYCEIQVSINKNTAEATFALMGD
jgi:hypothetical protein